MVEPIAEHHLPLVVICGPTASGKSALAMRIARKFDGEIICADSRTVYKGIDKGTAKPSLTDQKHIRHHLLDIVRPDQPFNTFDFQRQAKLAIHDIRSRGKTPLIVGGTGLYIDSVIFDYQFSTTPSIDKGKFETMTLEELHNYCSKNNIAMPENKKNKRYVISAILHKNNDLQKKNELINNTIVVGIATKKEDLIKKFIQRNEHFFKNGVVEEAKKLGEMYGWDGEAMTGNIYQTAKKVLTQELTVEEAVVKTTTLDWHLAKRQLTWLKRNPFICWGSSDELYSYVAEQLATRKKAAKLVS